MVTEQYPQRYRWDFIGLSTDDKPTPETSEKVVNGSTFYCSDTSKLYVFCDGTWYERKALGGGGGGGTEYTAGAGIDITNDVISVDTETIQPKLTAGSNVTINNNTISATDTTYSSFTGTDGTTAGTTGLVPAPATTDTDKFLKSDGTWAAAGGGGGGNEPIYTLTSADFNWNSTTNSDTEPYNCVALWKLPPGLYDVGTLTYDTQWKVRKDSGGNDNLYSKFIITTSSTSTMVWIFGFRGTGIVFSSDSEGIRMWVLNESFNTYLTTTFIRHNEIVDNLTTNATYRPLSAGQGKVLKGLIDALDARVTALEGN